ncbi:MAG: nicotinate-nucleotide adenylyltransferase [Bacteroidales bacterium]|nr:nicotinate-nucleotide adenylyltransferase [Bacteroidales bacterium]
MNIGLFFGSFNPIHNGHLMLAQYMANFGGVDEVWFVVSPQNPFKQDMTLLPAQHRIEMVCRAVEHTPHLKVSDIELHLPVPSYTINTLRALEARHPDDTFTLIMGGDNVAGLPRWREADQIMAHRILVYPRPGCDTTLEAPDMTVTDAPMVDISSTMIRRWVSRGHCIEHYVPHSVAQYISDNRLYL